MPEGDRNDRLLFTEGQIRTAFVASGVGMVALLVFVLILATSRPQGSYAVADDSQYRASLLAAAENLEGYELVGEARARIDIEHAIELVAERGVDLRLSQIDGPPPAPLAEAAPAEETAEEAADEAAPEPDATDADATPETDAEAAAGEDAEAEAAEDAGPVAVADAAAAGGGESVYAANCVACHQANGQGIPGAFPPLAGGHTADLANAGGGRDYLIRALLYGVQGQIVVAGQSYNGVMPGWSQLSDDDIAAVLNYTLTAWDNADALDGDVTPFRSEEIAPARGEGLAPTAVLEIRPDVP